MRRLVAAVLLILFVVFCVWVYRRHEAAVALGDGAVTNPDGSPITSSQPQGTGGGRASNQPPVSEQRASFSPAAPATAQTTMVPANDTVAPNAPNGLAFGGTGRFQWYRQDNLTWRVDTQNGEACIAFATMEEWNKPIVYSHGCGNS